jgi:two-component system OmpR family sensor kinase
VLGLLLGLAVALTGTLEHNPTLFRIGSALVVIAVAHSYDLCVTALPSHNLVFASVRVAGVLALLAAIVTGTHRAILDVDLEQSEQQEELRLAQLDLRQATERDHEVRNAVAGLAGAATLFDTRPPADEAATLRTAMVAELARLDALLAGPARHEPELTVCRVRPVLCQQVALRRCAGMEIGLQTELGLGAVGSATLLAQVLTNVLSNCAAHAAASPVWIDARRDGDHIQILVSDLGPGIAVEQEDDIFESGVRGGRSTGHGLGLHISRRLLAEVGGTITIRPRSVDQPGCTVELRLAAAEVAERPGELVALRRAS